MDDDHHLNMLTDADDMVTMGDITESGAPGGGQHRSMPQIVLHRSHSIDQIISKPSLKNAKVTEGKSR